MLRGLEAVKLCKKLRVLCNYQASWKRDDGGLFLLEFLFFFVSPILWTIQYHRRGILTAQNFPPKRKDGQLGGTQTVLQYLTYHFSDTRTSRLVSSFTEKPCQPNVKEMRIYALVFDRFSVKANHNMTILRKKLVSKPFRFKHKWVFLLTSFAAVEEEDDEITKWFDEKILSLSFPIRYLSIVSFLDHTHLLALRYGCWLMKLNGMSQQILISGFPKGDMEIFSIHLQMWFVEWRSKQTNAIY